MTHKEIEEYLEKAKGCQTAGVKDYYLKGLEITDEDFYFIFESKTGEKSYESCICDLT